MKKNRQIALNIAKGLTYSNLFIALCAACLSVFVTEALFLTKDKNLIGLVFFATLFAYNFQRKVGNYLSENKQFSQQDKWSIKHSKLINIIILLSFSFSFYFYYQLSREVILIVFPLGIISLLYILNIKQIPSLRSLPFLKVFVVGFVWGGAMVLLPVINQKGIENLLNRDVQLLTLSIAAFVFGESLPFDIRDWRNDKRSQLKTIPHRLGIKRTLLLIASTFSFSAILLSTLYWKGSLEFIYFIAALSAIVYTVIILSQLRLKRHPLYFSLLLESSLCSPLLFLYLFRLF